MKDYDNHGGDSLSDLGFFTATLLSLAGLAAVLYWFVPAFVRWMV